MKIQIWPGLEIWHWALTTQEYHPSPPHTHPKGLQLESVETNRCIPQEYRLVVRGEYPTKVYNSIYFTNYPVIQNNPIYQKLSELNQTNHDINLIDSDSNNSQHNTHRGNFTIIFEFQKN